MTPASRGPTNAETLIRLLRLEPLPGEGGFFRQTWSGRHASAMLFLLTRNDFSALHRLDRDEMWHFYRGHSVEHCRLDPSSGEMSVVRLGVDVLAGELPQLIVPAGCWQGARLAPEASDDDFALLGCTVSPPWDPACFTLGKRDGLRSEFPGHAAMIGALTR